MSSFLIARLPFEPKSLEAIDFMEKNHFSYRISSNSALLNVLMSSGAEDTRLAAAVGFWDGFEKVEEEIHLADQSTNIFEPFEVKVENTANQELEGRPDTVESVENRLVAVEQLNGSMEDVEDEAVADDEHIEEREEPNVTLIDEVDNTAEGPLLDVASTADDHFPLGNDFPEMVDEDDDVVLRSQRILDDSDGAIMDFDDSAMENKEDDSMDEVLVDEEIDEEESDEDHEDEENDGNESLEVRWSGESEDDAAVDGEDIKKEKKRNNKAATSYRLLFACPVKNCSSSYNTFPQLKEHVKTHTDKEKFFCDVCKKDFSSKRAVITHIQERMRTKCCACEKTSISRSHFLIHLRRHTGEKPYGCGYCKKRFAQQSTIKSHEKTHTGEKSFKCSYCDRRFAHKHHLMDHERTHTGEKPYSCRKCSKSYPSARALNAHYKTKHKLEKKP